LVFSWCVFCHPSRPVHLCTCTHARTPRVSCNEAESGSLALRLAGSIHGASTPRLLAPPSASLHAGRSVCMMNTFQFIGCCWRCWRTACTD
jgi:hypothetical protein